MYVLVIHSLCLPPSWCIADSGSTNRRANQCMHPIIIHKLFSCFYFFFICCPFFFAAYSFVGDWMSSTHLLVFSFPLAKRSETSIHWVSIFLCVRSYCALCWLNMLPVHWEMLLLPVVVCHLFKFYIVVCCIASALRCEHNAVCVWIISFILMVLHFFTTSSSLLANLSMFFVLLFFILIGHRSFLNCNVQCINVHMPLLFYLDENVCLWVSG